MTQARYIGATGDDVQLVHMAGAMFVKGQWTDVDDQHPQFAKLARNPTFEVKGGEEREEPSTDEVAELEALKAELRSRGVAVRGNPSLDTLRKRLAALAEDEAPAEPAAPLVGG